MPRTWLLVIVLAVPVYGGAACSTPDLGTLGTRARTVSSLHVVARAYHAEAGRGEAASIDWDSPWERVEAWKRGGRIKVTRTSDGRPTRVALMEGRDIFETSLAPDGTVDGARFPTSGANEALDLLGESWWLVEAAEEYRHTRSGAGGLEPARAPWATDALSRDLAWFEWRGPLETGPLSSDDERLWVGVSRADGYPRVTVKRIRENGKDPSSPTLDRIWRVDAFDVADVASGTLCFAREAATAQWWDGGTRQPMPAPAALICP